MLLTLTTLYQPTVLKNVVHTKTDAILHPKIHLSPRLPRRVILKSAWQVQNEGPVQHEGEMMIEPKIDFRIQGVSRAEVEQEEG